MPRAVRSRLGRVLDALFTQHGTIELPPPRTAFELVIWEKVAYLAPDARRAEAFGAFSRAFGLTPKKVLANRSAIGALLAGSGAGALERANNLISAAEMVVADAGGDLDAACAGSLDQAKRLLKTVRGIGDPGAEKILLYTRKHPVLGVDSNGLRVLTRLGYGVESKSYSATYRSATTAALAELGTDFDRLIQTNLLLRRHGQTICKATPLCGACGTRALCPSRRET